MERYNTSTKVFVLYTINSMGRRINVIQQTALDMQPMPPNMDCGPWLSQGRRKCWLWLKALLVRKHWIAAVPAFRSN